MQSFLSGPRSSTGDAPVCSMGGGASGGPAAEMAFLIMSHDPRPALSRAAAPALRRICLQPRCCSPPTAQPSHPCPAYPPTSSRRVASRAARRHAVGLGWHAGHVKGAPWALHAPRIDHMWCRLPRLAGEMRVFLPLLIALVAQGEMPGRGGRGAGGGAWAQGSPPPPPGSRRVHPPPNPVWCTSPLRPPSNHQASALRPIGRQKLLPQSSRAA